MGPSLLGRWNEDKEFVPSLGLLNGRLQDLQLKALLGDNDVERPLWMLFTEAAPGLNRWDRRGHRIEGAMKIFTSMGDIKSQPQSSPVRRPPSYIVFALLRHSYTPKNQVNALPRVLKGIEFGRGCFATTWNAMFGEEFCVLFGDLPPRPHVTDQIRSMSASSNGDQMADAPICQSSHVVVFLSPTWKLHHERPKKVLLRIIESLSEHALCGGQGR